MAVNLSAQGTVFVKVQGGLSDYLGDNNTVPFNTAAFNVEGKWPYSVGGEVGYRRNARWSASLGAQWANYPLVTRFYENLPVADHPTLRSTYQFVARYTLPGRWLYTHVGYHVTLGDVNIFEVERLAMGIPLNTQRHYVHGPLLGVGLAYPLASWLSLFAEATTHVSLMDDSVDGRLPLGPPQPTNLREVNRFGTFDLLNAFGLGFIYRPTCGIACARRLVPGRDAPKALGGHGLFQLMKTGPHRMGAVSYHYALPGRRTLLLGIEAGWVPRAITVRYAFADGQNSHDRTPFTGSFIGVSSRWYPLRTRPSRLQPHAGLVMAIPAQAHGVIGLGYRLGDAVSLGLEARALHCPIRRQHIRNTVLFQGTREDVIYHMKRTCEVGRAWGVTLGYRL